MIALFIFTALLMTPAQLQPASRFDRWIIWNVGQGLWTTEVLAHECRHFDAGGERWPRSSLRRLCPGPQKFFLSHGDWDHIGGLSWIRRWTQSSCVSLESRHGLSKRKRDILESFTVCKNPAQEPGLRAIHHACPDSPRESNARSSVWTLHDRWLLPGDSPSSQEKIWAARIASQRKSLRVLVLGHHGSRTSTSAELLTRLPHLRMGVASARRARHGHPHRDVITRLRKARIALVRTEDWGHLIFEL